MSLASVGPFGASLSSAGNIQEEWNKSLSGEYLLNKFFWKYKFLGENNYRLHVRFQRVDLTSLQYLHKYKEKSRGGQGESSWFSTLQVIS